MFQIHEVYRPTRPFKNINGTVRVIDLVGLERVVLINMDAAHQTVPFSIDYTEWVDLLNNRTLEKVPDPFLLLTSAPTGLPQGVAGRLKAVIAVTAKLSQKPDLLHQPRTLAREISAASQSMSLSSRTVKRWVLDWLQAGRNPAAVVRKFIDKLDDGDKSGPQKRGAKRGARNTKPETASTAPAYEIRDVCEKAFTSYVKARRMTWRDAYYEMLIALCGIPEEELKNSENGLLMDPVLIEKYRPPTWPQCRYVFRKQKKKELSLGVELPRGKRGKAIENVPGPGFFEIDATFFQIQLVSRVTSATLVGRPTVYLIVDIYDGVIVGYAVTLENPSWAVAALALYNCFSDKRATFDRLGLPFTSTDWPCHHLPTVLRADRAELVSNMGQDFPASGIRVEVTPSMVAIAKGTVEGKNSELKREHPGRFDLPGRFKKARARRQSDGKKDAALDILKFERILVEIIMDINGEPMDPRRIPPDAFQLGAKVASRIGFHDWAMTNRAGFTREMGAHFVYEHLLTKARGTVTPLGIKLENELFNCDRLRDIGYLVAAVDSEFELTISYTPHYAGEVFFYDREMDKWISAANIDAEIDRYKMTFAEAKEYRATQRLMVQQAGLNNHARRRERVPVIRQAIKDSLIEKASLGVKTKASNAHIRENRKQEKASQRTAGFNGALPKPAAPPSVIPVEPSSEPISQTDMPDQVPLATPPASSRPATDAISLWSEVDAVQKH